MGWPWQNATRPARETALEEVTNALGQVLGGSPGAATPETLRPTAFLGADLGLTSLAFARLAGVLQKRRGRTPLPFHTLFVEPGGAVLQDVRVSDLVAFLERHREPDGP